MHNIEEAVRIWTAVYLGSKLLAVTEFNESYAAEPVEGMGTGISWPAIMERRTILMGGGRQNGKTSFLAKMMREHPKAIIVTMSSLQKAFVTDHPDIDPSRVYCTASLETAIRQNESLEHVTHLLVDDARYNDLSDPHWASVVDGVFNRDLICVMMG